MIIVDFQQVMISNLMAQIGNHTNIQIEESLFRHMVINSLRGYRTKFKEYGEMVIACDDKNFWRRQIFPYYKANRKKARDKSELDWTSIFEYFGKLKAEIKENFPYRMIQIDTAEADDIIATLIEHFGSDMSEKIMILSGDKDFIQLHKYPNVKQYDPVRKKMIHNDDPNRYLFEHILKGDAGDGVPNILSDDDTFVTDKRQKPMTQKKIDEFFYDKMNTQMQRNWNRNQQLIDLGCVPKDIRKAIIDKYHEEGGKDRSKLFNYFISYKLKNMMESVGDF